jgi:hypothetical protein
MRRALIGASRCDPWGLGVHAFAARYYIGLASYLLAGGHRSSYGICQPIKSMTGWDREDESWRTPAVFGGRVDTIVCCDRMDATTHEALVFELAPCTVPV